MLWLQIILIIGAITIGGFVFCEMIIASANGPLRSAEGLEFMNPFWWYRNYPVNPFGAAMCSLGFTILCPVGAIGYWFYKLCTVGRRQSNDH